MFECSAMRLSGSSALRRESTRPPEFRPVGFESEFDAHSILYDVFRTRCGSVGKIVLVGPPWLNLLPLLEQIQIDGTPLAIRESNVWFRDRCAEVWITSETDTQITLDLGDETISAGIRNEECEIYRGKRVLHTMSRDNDIAWIIDWAKFHVARHGVNGLLVYDNDSSRYGPVELELALRDALPDIVTNVVNWPYPFGANGYTSDSWWDSDFCQNGAFQHARIRFLALASSVLNCDVDELVLSLHGDSIFERTEHSDSGYISFSGKWIASVPSAMAQLREPDQPARHGQYRFLEQLSGECPRKWCVVPGRCDLSHQ